MKQNSDTDLIIFKIGDKVTINCGDHCPLYEYNGKIAEIMQLPKNSRSQYKVRIEGIKWPERYLYQNQLLPTDDNSLPFSTWKEADEKIKKLLTEKLFGK